MRTKAENISTTTGGSPAEHTVTRPLACTATRCDCEVINYENRPRAILELPRSECDAADTTITWVKTHIIRIDSLQKRILLRYGVPKRKEV